MGNSIKKVKRKQYIIYSSFIRKYSPEPYVDVNNSYEIPTEFQILYLKLSDKEQGKAQMKILYMPDDTEKYAQLKTDIENEWKLLLKLNEHANILHYLGREYSTDKDMKRQCEILAQHFPINIDQVKNATKTQSLMWISQLAQAISYAHSEEITHGNIIPSNIVIANDSAVLKGFTFCKYTNIPDFRILSKSDQEKNMLTFGPPTAIQEENTYWKKKKDIYMWATCSLYILGYKKALEKLKSAKGKLPVFYNNALIEVQNELLTSLKQIESSGINSANLTAILISCLRPDPLNRPSMEHALKLFENLDDDISDSLKTICQFCGRGKHKLHELRCLHKLCRKCWLRENDDFYRTDLSEESKELNVKKTCRICNMGLALGILQLRCGCREDKIELEREIFETTKGRILQIDSENKGYVYPKCKQNHAICFEDLELIFGEERIEEARKSIRTTLKTIATEEDKQEIE